MLMDAISGLLEGFTFALAFANNAPANLLLCLCPAGSLSRQEVPFPHNQALRTNLRLRRHT